MFKAGIEQARAEVRFVLLSTIGALVVGLLLMTPLQRAYDDHFRARPFISALVELVPTTNGAPDVRYVARAETKVSGRWSAWVDIDGRRGCGGGGEAGYGPPAKEPKLWLWSDWLGRDCAVPEGPFSVCVRYAVETSTGAGDIAGPFCSRTFHPKGLRK